MNYIGLSLTDNSAVCIVQDGRLVAAIEEERLSRIKNSKAFPILAFEECLRIADLDIADIDVIYIAWKPWVLWVRTFGLIKKSFQSWKNVSLLFSRAKQLFLPAGNGNTGERVESGAFYNMFRARSIINREIGTYVGKIKFVNHHETHIRYGCAMRSWDTCAFLSYDGGGENKSTIAGIRNGRSLEYFMSENWPNSLGHFYSFFTGFLGFKMLEGEYKMMGLAPYGKPIYKEIILAKILQMQSDGSYKLDTHICDYHMALKGRFPAKAIEIFGSPRRQGGIPSQDDIDLAASVQAAFEEVQQHILRALRKNYPDIKTLIISGGCALNVTANGKVIDNKIFDEISIPPAPHDAGCAIGAVLVGLNIFELENIRSPYLGSEYSNAEILMAFDKLGLTAPQQLSFDDVVEKTATFLSEGDIVCWFQGRSEFGPRALGCRSYLADPRNDGIREVINEKIKKRELFRPFAPSVVADEMSRFFELNQESPYMNIVARVRDDKKDRIPAITHIDQTARVHSVTKESNPKYYRLLKAFGEKADDTPVLLNTSFNIQEPIVNSPEDAIKTFLNSDVDHLVIGDFICSKNWRT